MAKAKPEPHAPGREGDDDALWAHVTRDAKPLSRRGERPPPPPAAGRERQAVLAPAQAPPAPRSATLPAPQPLPELSRDAAPGLDKRTAERLRQGELAIEARLDLHGHTQEEAHRALIAFVEEAWRRRCRALLVITGKGRSGEGEGILRAAVPRWLNGAPLRSRLLAFAAARPRDGGSGALYLLLRRQR